MTKYQKDQYSIRYNIEEYICYKTKSRASHIAHRIANNKTNRLIYGELIINHNFNLVPVSNLSINDFFNIGFNPKKCEKLIQLINERTFDIIKSEEITRLINE